MKVLTLDGLISFFNKLKETFANRVHTHTVSEITDYIEPVQIEEFNTHIKEFNNHIEQALYYEIEDALELPDVTLTSNDDGSGNVVVTTTGMTITDDGEENISITSDYLSVTDDRAENITISV